MNLFRPSIRHELCSVIRTAFAQLQMIALCFRTFTRHSLSHFTKIHFKPPHMVLAAAGGKIFELFPVIFRFLSAAGCMQGTTSSMSIYSLIVYLINMPERDLLRVDCDLRIYNSEVLRVFSFKKLKCRFVHSDKIVYTGVSNYAHTFCVTGIISLALYCAPTKEPLCIIV